MRHHAPHPPERIIEILLRLKHGEATKDDILRDYRISAEQLEHWLRAYPTPKPLSERTATSRIGDVCLALAVLAGLAMYALHQHASELLSAQFRLPLLLVFCIAVAGLVLEDARRGAVRVGRYRTIRREERPFVFWAIIIVQGLMALAFAWAALVATG